MKETALTGVASGTASVETLFQVLAAGLAVFTAITLWPSFSPDPNRDGTLFILVARTVGAYVVITVVSVTLLVATYAWLLELFSE